MSEGLEQLAQSIQDDFRNTLETMKADAAGGFSRAAAMPDGGNPVPLGHVIVSSLVAAGMTQSDAFKNTPAFYDYILRSKPADVRNIMLTPGGLHITAQNFASFLRMQEGPEEKINFDYLFLVAHLNQSAKALERAWGAANTQAALNALNRAERGYAQLQLDKLRKVAQLDVPALIKSSLISRGTKKNLSLLRAALLRSDDETDILERHEPVLRIAANAAEAEKIANSNETRKRLSRHIKRDRAEKYYENPENRGKTAAFRAHMLKKIVAAEGLKKPEQRHQAAVSKTMQTMRTDSVIPGSATSGAYIVGLMLAARSAGITARKKAKIALAATPSAPEITPEIAPETITPAPEPAAPADLSPEDVLHEFPALDAALVGDTRGEFWKGIEAVIANQPEQKAALEKMGQTEYLRAFIRTLDAARADELIKIGRAVISREQGLDNDFGGPK